ncbi:MAG: [Oscillospiraceae bacterium]|nr:[FeFe] hydrogenase H-cluster radical SAM maturase HydE [Oscillospiraceae bacterium]
MSVRPLIDRLNAEKSLSLAEWRTMLTDYTEDDRQYAAEIARGLSTAVFGNQIYLRGIVEFSNYCKNNCLYCGIRCGNQTVQRYRLTEDEILECCAEGYALGFRTFVLQSGEDSSYFPDRLPETIRRIKQAYPDCAVTLSVGELEFDMLKRLRECGADRYLLRHETADQAHYEMLHPQSMSFAHRMQCLRDLKSLGYQTGAGIMVGSPHQTADCIAKDMLFFTEFQPHMIGIGPFLPAANTPFEKEPVGSYELTLFLLSLCRILLPNVLLPATTALGTIRPDGREQGILSGANVIMPNLSPTAVRKKYMLYDNKICTGEEAAQCIGCLNRRVQKIGYALTFSRGDHPDMQPKTGGTL